MPPENTIMVFDGIAMVVMFIWGLLVKYLPALAKVPNWLIAWTNIIGYVATKLAGGPSNVHAGEIVLHAGFFGNILPGIVPVLIGGFTNSIWARQLYEGFGRSLLEKKFGWKAAVPK